jgi:hypothetical protein
MHCRRETHILTVISYTTGYGIGKKINVYPFCVEQNILMPFVNVLVFFDYVYTYMLNKIST